LVSWHDDPASPADADIPGVRRDRYAQRVDGLAVLVQQVLEQSPHSGALFAFRGKRGDLVKLLRYDRQGLCLFSKRMDRGRFIIQIN
jgi:transposase